MRIRSSVVAAFTLAAVLAGCGQGEAESLAAVQPTAAQAFKDVHALGQTDQIATYADVATLKREGRIVTIWLLSAYTPEAAAKPGIRFVEARERYDCEAGTKAVLMIRAIDKAGGIVAELTVAEPKAEPFNPTGVFGLSAQVFCEPGELEGRRRVADYRRDAVAKLQLD